MFLYAGLGLLQPLFPLYLTSRGLSAHTATFVLALGPLASVTAAQGLLAAAAGVGSAVGMVLAGVVFDAVGGQAVFACAAIASLVAVVGALVRNDLDTP